MIQEQSQSSIKRIYTAKNIFHDATSLILEQAFLYKVDQDYEILSQSENTSKLMINGRKIEITLLQIQKTIILILVDGAKKPIEIRFNTASYLKEQLSNSYRIPKSFQDLEQLFHPKNLLTFKNVLTYRLNRVIQGRDQTIDSLIDYKILVFLDARSLLNLMSVSHQAVEQNKDQNQWSKLFNFRYGKTGFEVKNLNWKSLYLKQVKHKRKWIKQ